MWMAPSGGGPDKGMWKESFLPLFFLEFLFCCEFIYSVAAADSFVREIFFSLLL